MRLAKTILSTTLFAAWVLVPGPVAAASDCSHLPPERQMPDEGILLTEGLGLASGRYALPETDEPTQLVILMHGYGNDSCSWRNHLRAVAARGAVAVSMDYSGQDPITQRGWRVLEGAADSIAAAQHFLEAYPTIDEVFAFGVSMGGNASGMLVADPGGAAIVDHWIAVEGVHDLAQEYLIARAVAPFNATGANASADIEEETGGPIEAVPDAYVHLTNVARAPDMGGLQSAVLVHGFDDGTVPSNQSREMAAALRAVGVPTELTTVLGRGDGEPGSTGTAIVGGPAFGAAGLTYEAPTAGHGWEGSDEHLVIRTGFARLFALMDGEAIPAYREVVVHGEDVQVGAP